MELEEVLEGKRMSSLKLKMISGGSMLLPTENQIRVYWIMRGRGSWSLNAWSWKRCWRGKDMLIQRLRKKSLSKEVSKKAFTEVDEFGRPVLKETHQIAEAQKEKNKQLKEAFGISEYFVEGSSFDPNRRALEEAARDGGRPTAGLDEDTRDGKKEKKRKKKKKVSSSESESEDSEDERRRRKEKKKNKKRSRSRSVERRRRGRSEEAGRKKNEDRSEVGEERRERGNSRDKQRKERNIIQDRERSEGRRRSSQERDRRGRREEREVSVEIKEEKEADDRGIQWETNKRDKRSERERRDGIRQRSVKEEPESPVKKAASGEGRSRRNSP